MKDGYIKVAAVTPQVTVADVKENTKEILKVIREAGSPEGKDHCIAGALHYRIHLSGFIFAGNPAP